MLSSAILLIFTVIASVLAKFDYPLDPGDNSNYEDAIIKKSLNIWKHNSSETELVDLMDVNNSINDGDNGALSDCAGITYYLYTRLNRSKGYVIVYNNITTIKNARYMSDRPTSVIVHGWKGSKSDMRIKLIKAAFLYSRSVNVLVVDWNKIAGKLYKDAARGVFAAGKHLGEFLLWLKNATSGNFDNFHLVGHGLGAHLAGIAGRAVEGKIARVTGLDPASPGWKDNPKALNKTSGVYVETINTDGKNMGIFYPLGHVNFYPNGGKGLQPGCLTSRCSHNKSCELFAASVRYNHLVGEKCNDLEEARKKACNGDTFMMGNGLFPKRGSGIYGLTTKKFYPY